MTSRELQESRGNLQKSLALLVRTTEELAQLDQAAFPTPASATARHLLVRVFCILQEPSVLGPVDPLVFYSKVLELRKLAHAVQNSSIETLCWPIVAYCDKV